MTRRARTSWISAVGVGALWTLPFWLVEIPPITDLPQQLAQIHLLGDALEDGSPYRVQWWHPNKLGYLLLGAAHALGSALGDVLLAAPIAGALLVLTWVGALHAAAFAWRRPPEAAALASILVFAHPTSWGLVTFQVGFPIFLAWITFLQRERAKGERTRPLVDGLGVLGLSLALYSAHVLWLLAGLAWLALDTVLRRRPLEARGALARRSLPRALGVLPAVVLVALWYPTLERSGFTSEVFAGSSPVDRLAPEMVVASFLGGVAAPLEAWTLGALGLWLIFGTVGALRARSTDWGGSIEHRLLIASALLALLYLALPEVAQNTILLATRWAPPALALALLAIPRPPVRPALARTMAALLVAAFALGIANLWTAYEREELAGLVPSLRALGPAIEDADDPGSTRLLGLDLVGRDELMPHRPSVHLYAYGQLLHGVDLARSFAEASSSLVVHRQLPFDPPWTEHLDTKPQRLQRADWDHFDVVLIHAPDAMQAHFETHPRVRPITERARWRLYRVVEPTSGLVSGAPPSSL